MSSIKMGGGGGGGGCNKVAPDSEFATPAIAPAPITERLSPVDAAFDGTY